jgi:hypothetical protein
VTLIKVHVVRLLALIFGHFENPCTGRAFFGIIEKFLNQCQKEQILNKEIAMLMGRSYTKDPPKVNLIRRTLRKK